jgi:hypothetical protein
MGKKATISLSEPKNSRVEYFDFFWLIIIFGNGGKQPEN